MTLCNSMNCSMPGFSVLHYRLELLKLISTESVMSSNHFILCCPLQSFPSSVHFPVSQLFSLGGQRIGTSASASVLPMNIQGWFSLELTGLISLKSKGLSRVSYNTTVWRYQFLGTQPSLWFSFHIHTWLLEKSWLWLYGSLSAK